MSPGKLYLIVVSNPIYGKGTKSIIFVRFLKDEVYELKLKNIEISSF